MGARRTGACIRRPRRHPRSSRSSICPVIVRLGRLSSPRLGPRWTDGTASGLPRRGHRRTHVFPAGPQGILADGLSSSRIRASRFAPRGAIPVSQLRSGRLRDGSPPPGTGSVGHGGGCWSSCAGPASRPPDARVRRFKYPVSLPRLLRRTGRAATWGTAFCLPASLSARRRLSARQLLLVPRRRRRGRRWGMLRGDMRSPSGWLREGRPIRPAPGRGPPSPSWSGRRSAASFLDPHPDHSPS